MISISSSGSFKKTESFLETMRRGKVYDRLEAYGRMGVEALRNATPQETGLTADSWTYEVRRKSKFYSIIWKNTNVVDGVPVAIILQYGHATGTGGWVEGRDYINPVVKPLFDKIAKDVWEEVKRA